MNVKSSVYIATSVDGFIARSDGDINWLHNPKYGHPDDLGLSYGDFIASVDALLMGRNSFEKVLSFPEWSYEGVLVVVLSNKAVTLPKNLEGKVQIEQGEPVEIVSRLAAQGKKHLYIDGGATIQRFLRAGLINEITITQIPIILGAGISLFGEVGAEISLQLIESTACSNGFVQNRYVVDYLT